MRPQAPEGLDVRVTHLRYGSNPEFGIRRLRTKKDLRSVGLAPEPKGGQTIVRLLRDGEELVRSSATCSREDNFCRRTGRDIALGRALKELGPKAA